MGLASRPGLGVPQLSRDAFLLLETAGVLTADTACRMRAMVSVRDFAVHKC